MDGHGSNRDAAQRTRDRQRLRGRSENRAKVLPVRNRFGGPLRSRVAGKLHGVSLPGPSPFGKFPDVGDDRRIQIQANDFEVFCFSKVKPSDRLEHRKRLQRLYGVEIVAVPFVGEIQPRPDNGNSAHAPKAKGAFTNHRTQCFFEGKIRQERSVDRKPASLEECSARQVNRGRVFVVCGILKFLLICGLLGDEALKVLGELSLFGIFSNTLAREKITDETNPFILGTGTKGERQGVDASDGSRPKLAGFRGGKLYTFYARKRGERRPEEDQIADGIFDAAVNSAANLPVSRADPGVPPLASLDLAAGKPGIGIATKRFLDFIETKIADRVLSGKRRKKEKTEGGRPCRAPHRRAQARTRQFAE